jgi:putative phosphoesterase
MKFGLISDIHATLDPLREALTVFEQEHVDAVLCTGDIAGYGEELEQTVELLIKSKCQVITGNHEIWFINSPVPERQKWIKEFFSDLPSTLAFTIAGQHLYMVHASPPFSNMKGIKLLDQQGNVIPDRKQRWTDYLNKFNHDVLIVGHTHQVFAERLGNTLVINPGSTKFNHTCMTLTLPEQEVRIFPVSDKTPQKVWNWGQMEQMYED